MVLQARKIAVTCKPLFHQGRGLSKNKIARLDFEKKCGVHRFCSDTPCVVWSKSIRTRKTAVWKAKRRKTGDFERFLPFFSSLLFFEKIPIHFAIFSDRKDLNPRKRDFQKKRNRIEQPKGLELATRFQPFRLFCCLHGMFTNRRLQNKSLGVG